MDTSTNNWIFIGQINSWKYYYDPLMQVFRQRHLHGWEAPRYITVEEIELLFGAKPGDDAWRLEYNKIHNPVWIVTPKREEDREVAKVAEQIINSKAWQAEFDSRVARRLYQEVNHMEVIDKRCPSVSINVLDIPSGAVFEGSILGKPKTLFMRIGGRAAYAIFSLKNTSDHWSNQNLVVSEYQRLHGKITIERNA